MADPTLRELLQHAREHLTEAGDLSAGYQPHRYARLVGQALDRVLTYLEQRHAAASAPAIDAASLRNKTGTARVAADNEPRCKRCGQSALVVGVYCHGKLGHDFGAVGAKCNCHTFDGLHDETCPERPVSGPARAGIVTPEQAHELDHMVRAAYERAQQRTNEMAAKLDARPPTAELHDLVLMPGESRDLPDGRQLRNSGTALLYINLRENTARYDRPAVTDATSDDALAGWLDELQRLCDRAEPAPWELDDDEAYVTAAGTIVFAIDNYPRSSTPTQESLAAARFAITARDALPKLIAKVRELQARTDNAERLREYADQRLAVLTECFSSPVCRMCHQKRKGTHCADCRGALLTDSDGDYYVDEGPDHA